MEEKTKREARIKLTITLPPDVKPKDVTKAIGYFDIAEDWIGYTLAMDYPTTAFLNSHGEEENTVGTDFQFKKYETAIVRRKDLVGVTKTSYTEFDTQEKEAKYVHMLMIESAKSQMGLTCTWEEKNKYYPYLEDYYKGGDKWKELINE